MAKRNFSPLRYPGGKSQLANYVERLINIKKLNKSTYIEPFCGGAAVALYLLINGYVSNVIINDYDRSIYAFWYCCLNKSNELCKLIKDTKINVDEWYKQREIQKFKNEVDLLSLGFSTLFLNRTNRSGIINAGVIGGVNQNGKYKINCRFNKEKIIEKIKRIASFKERIYLYNFDAGILIDNVINKLNHKSFIFFDPPYYKKGKCLYTNFYEYKDHSLLANKIKSIKYHSWVVTYDDEEEIKNMYRGFVKETYKLNYFAGKNHKGDEVIFYSKTLSKNILSEELTIDKYCEQCD